MAIHADRDSSFQLAFVPLSDSGGFSHDAAQDGNGDLAPTPAVPVFDLLSDGPLPPLSDDSSTAFSDLLEARQTRATSPAAPAQSTPPADPATSSADPATLAAGQFWLEGDVIMCACPDCGAPMAVRLWLMIADCWRCGASIELSEQQEREVRRLLEKREEAKHRSAEPKKAATPQHGALSTKPRKTERPKTSQHVAAAAAAPLGKEAAPSAADSGQSATTSPSNRSRDSQPATRPQPDHSPSRESESSRPKSATLPTPPPTPSRRRRRRVRATGRATGTQGRIRRRARTGFAHAVVRDLLKITPAWLVSAVFHLVLITILALITRSMEDEDDPMVLSATVSVDRQEGGKVEQDDEAKEVKLELPPPRSTAEMTDDEIREVKIADQVARELRVDPDAQPREIPDVAVLKAKINHPNAPRRRSMLARDPQLRVEMVSREGGTTYTEAAVARGLKWLSEHQNEDGSWSLHNFHRNHGGRPCGCDGHGSVRNDWTGTSLALLPFLGAGQTHYRGRYKDTVANGLRWLVDHQSKDGCVGGKNVPSNSLMYTHGQGTIVLCEAFAMEGDEDLRAPAQKAVEFIERAQYTDGGWRYQPAQLMGRKNMQGDTSVVGWQLMALQSARAAGLDVDKDTLNLANHFLTSVQTDDIGSKYAYQGRRSPTQIMTAEALLCRIYLGWDLKQPGLVEGVDWLAANHLPSDRSRNMYYWYYATQTMHHVGGPSWKKWNERMRQVLVEAQEIRGHGLGSWSPRGFTYGSAGGRIYVTALATCTLEVYYRHLPIFKKIELE